LDITGPAWLRFAFAVTPHITIKDGDLLDQPVEVIVNAWNRNFIPWWLLLPQGVSGAIKRRAGCEPFRELSRKGVLPLGGAVITGAGRLPFRGIIHVAGIGLLWRSSEESVRKSVRNALALATQRGFRSVAFPLSGAGTGGGRPERVQAIMEEEIKKSEFTGDVLLVRFKKNSEPGAPRNGGPAPPVENSNITEGPPSVS
jgi:O-acetyl-ADP-ribose deacetylase (regulator of RNase III)